MNEFKIHLKVFKEDELEVFFSQKLFSFLTLSSLYHFFKDPFMNLILKKKLVRVIPKKDFPSEIDFFLHNEGGLHKMRVYSLCNQLKDIKGSKILVPGCGFGRNLIQLISFQPKEIVAFDIYNYPKEWDFLKKYAEKKGVKLVFLKKDILDVSKKYPCYFDSIFSDAVLEHIQKLDVFLTLSYSILKSKGLFYAGFGPLWFGPGGDHVYWGDKRIYDHLLLSESEYKRNVEKRYKENHFNSFDLINEKLFSFKSVQEYFNLFKKANLSSLKIYSKISTKALKLLEKDKKLNNFLTLKKVPLFDRYCPGLYVWYMKR